MSILFHQNPQKRAMQKLTAIICTWRCLSFRWTWSRSDASKWYRSSVWTTYSWSMGLDFSRDPESFSTASFSETYTGSGLAMAATWQSVTKGEKEGEGGGGCADEAEAEDDDGGHTL